ncbi:pilus assembly protein PilC [Neisseria sp. HMSC067G11]|jgi:pilC protein|uniref:PilC family type IV pilus tip adhesin n=2 Tax=Neisseriaceae TaxID=481 RepID=UPI00066A887A|nr:PilC family type IV pilus tip adhesin [Neisseria sp. HMSC067G12]OFK03889.1 pilus assembly protein PilC [Neisseria sp. HMSC067H04]OFL34772.1 pilus assembly protein PilC [Neisseria sp. HMSC075C12]OFR55625.1 pilus assembly protein PilC [Neisseria sp. HMSC067G11]OFR73881.1 pilus assembly protein PilC [Neisseria sp. HMSC067G12]
MKKEHIMQNAPSGRHRLIHASVASALALISISVQANTQQFAQTPFYLQNKTDVSGQPKVKHNIMFLIDDSGSMQWNVQGKETSVRADKRITITKEALKSVLKEYGEKQRFQWGLQTLHNNGRTDTPDEGGFTDDWKDVQRRVDGIDPGHATPITRRYYEVVKNFVMPNIKYRCQKSYVIVMSDGDANMSCSNQIPGEDPRLSRNTNFNYDRDYYYSNYYRDIERSAGTSAYQYFGPSEVKANDDSYGKGKFFNGGGRIKGYFDFLPYQYDNDFGLPENEKKLLCQSSKYKHEYDPNYGRYMWVAAGEIIVPYWDRNYKDEKRGMRFFSQTLAEKDIKTAKDGSDAAGKSWDGDPSDPKGIDYSKQLVQTFTVGFGEGISEVGREYLEKGASRPDWYFNAAKKEDLLEAFKTIVDNIENDSKNTKFEGVSSTAPATTSMGIPDMAATVHLNTGSWSSQLRFYKLNRDGTPINTTEFVQPSFNNRLTLVNDGSKTYFIDRVADNEASNADFGISDGSAKDKLEWKNALLKWTGRVGSDETIKADAETKGYSQSYRIRPTDSADSSKDERNLGDILDGSVAAIGDKRDNRQEFLVAAANDGMVHIFRNGTSSNPYDLKLSYIPAGMEREDDQGQTTTLGKVLKDIARDGYGSGTPHRYMVNGGFVLRQTPDKQTFMFGAMGQGGRGAYALNIGAVANSDRSGWNTTVPLFETEKGSGNKLGYTIGSTQIGRVSIKRDTTPVNLKSDVRYAGFLASGYRTEDVNSADNETALYIYDMTGKEAGTQDTGKSVSSAGNLLAKISVPNGKGGLSTPTLVDTDFDGIVDIAYAGDRYGNMFRFDLSGETPSEWSVQMIFQGSGNQPITSAPAVSRRSKDKYVVIFGTGSEIYQNELEGTNGQINAVYGIYDDVSTDESKKAVLANSSELEQQTRESDGEHIYVSDNKVGEGKKGWSLTLGSNERVTVKPTMILRTAVVTIRKYETKTTHTDSSSTDVCLPDSTSTQTTAKTIILGVNAENGGRLGLRDARISSKDRTFIKRENNGQIYYANGMTFDGVINFTYMNSSKADDSPVTADGDSGGTGTDKELNATPSVPNNKCFATKGDRSLLSNQLDSLEVQGRTCGLKRISWRELFF